jgi:Tfp pilus assembly pilus retraction ATPase PilT
MAALQWDRLLATCTVRRASDILLSPGVQPLLRQTESWSPLQASPVDAAYLQQLVDAHLGAKPDGQTGDYAFWDFRFGDDPARFRAAAFGYPATRLLLITRFPPDGADTDHCPQCGSPVVR